MDLSRQIERLFRDSVCLRASIAFWTLSLEQVEYLSNDRFLKVLTNSDSFLCVDIQYPTNLDNIAHMVKEGISVYLNIRKLPRALDPRRISTSPGLLHTKTLIANKTNGDAELWLGSHNWTAPALIGPNTEMSVAINLTTKSPLYLETEDRINQIRDNYCQPFDLKKIEYYKKLQKQYERDTKSKIVIELEGKNVDNLAGEVICIFGTESDDYQNIPTINRKIVLSIYSSDGCGKFLYTAKILQSGLLEASNPLAGGISFEERRYAYTIGRSFPYLESVQPPSSDAMTKALFFVNLEIISYRTRNYSLYNSYGSAGKNTRWTKSIDDPITSRMNNELIDFFYGQDVLPNNLIEVPSDNMNAEEYENDYKYVEYSEIPLEQKRIDGYRLLRKMVVDEH